MKKTALAAALAALSSTLPALGIDTVPLPERKVTGAQKSDATTRMHFNPIPCDPRVCDPPKADVRLESKELNREIAGALQHKPMCNPTNCDPSQASQMGKANPIMQR